MALPVGRRARTTSSDTWGLPPPGTTTPPPPWRTRGSAGAEASRESRSERADRRWRQGVEIMGRSGDGGGRRSRRRAPPELAVVPRDEGSAWVALECGGRARTTSSDTWGLPPPGTTTPTAPLENPWIWRPRRGAEASRAEREQRAPARAERDDRQQQREPASREPTDAGAKALKSWGGAGTERVDVPGGGPLPNSPSFRARRGADGWHWIAAGARERRAQTPGASHRRERRPPPPPWRTRGSASEEGLPAGDLRGQARRAERERKESGKRAGGRDGELSARLRRDEHFGDTCGGSGLELPIARPYGSREIQGDREEVMTREKNVLILGAPRSKVRLPSTPGGNAGPKKGAPKEETS